MLKTIIQIHLLINIRTVYGQVTATSTVTEDTTVPSRTVTSTATFIEFELRKRQNQVAARAAIPTAAYLKKARDAIDNDIAKRQASGFVTPDYPAILSSGCSCGPPTPLKTNAVCTAEAEVREFQRTHIAIADDRRR